MKRNMEKGIIFLPRADRAYVGLRSLYSGHCFSQAEFRAAEGNGNKTEYATEIDGYDMADLSMYGNLRVYDLLDANGFTDYEGSGYNRSYRYDSEDFRNLKGLDESYLYGFYCATSEENFNAVLSVLGYDSLEQYLTEKEYVDEDENPSIDAWNDSSMSYLVGLLKQDRERDDAAE